jgi:hypothetical protein
MVSTHKASRRGQKVHGGLGNDPTRPNITSVARNPTMRTADAEARRRTHTIARGGCAARDGVSACATAIGSGAMVFPRRDERRRAFPNLPDHIRLLVLRLVIRPRLHLGEQPERDQLHARNNQQESEQQQRPVADRLPFDSFT